MCVVSIIQAKRNTPRLTSDAHAACRNRRMRVSRNERRRQTEKADAIPLGQTCWSTRAGKRKRRRLSPSLSLLRLRQTLLRSLTRDTAESARRIRTGLSHRSVAPMTSTEDFVPGRAKEVERAFEAMRSLKRSVYQHWDITRADVSAPAASYL